MKDLNELVKRYENQKMGMGKYKHWTMKKVYDTFTPYEIGYVSKSQDYQRYKTYRFLLEKQQSNQTQENQE